MHLEKLCIWIYSTMLGLILTFKSRGKDDIRYSSVHLFLQGDPVYCTEEF